MIMMKVMMKEMMKQKVNVSSENVDVLEISNKAGVPNLLY